MNSSISRSSAAWLIGPDRDPPWHTVSESVNLPDDHPLMEHVRRYNPMGRMGTPEDFEGIGVYFMSDWSRFHTGDVVIIEGGWMANAGKSDITELPPWP